MKRLVLLAAALLCACSTGPPLTTGYHKEPLVLTAQASYGIVTVRQVSATTVQGVTPYGTARVTLQNGVIRGNSDAISVTGTVRAGIVTGEAVNGNYSFQIRGNRITGSVPDYDLALTLTGGNLVGYVGPGNTTITVGQGFRSLTNPDLIAALVIALPEWHAGH